MYDNIGGKIQKYASFLGWLGAGIGIAVFLLCLLLFKKVGFFIGVILGGSIFFSMWLSTWVLYGFGTLVTESEQQTRLLRKTEDSLEKLIGLEKRSFSAIPQNEAYAETAVERPISGTVRLVSSSQQIHDNDHATAHFSTRPKDEIGVTNLICPECGRKQVATRTCCYKCGTKFVFDDEM